jgi:flagellar hook-basal body complex protein FliE
MSIPSIEAAGFTPFTPQTVAPAGVGPADTIAGGSGPSGPEGSSGVNFGDMLAGGLQRMEAVNDRADQLAVQAATGDLSNLHDYTIAATEASVTTQLTTAVRNKALEAFNEIMRMSI